MGPVNTKLLTEVSISVDGVTFSTNTELCYYFSYFSALHVNALLLQSAGEFSTAKERLGE